MTEEQFDRFIESYKEFLVQITELRRLGVDLTSENKKFPVESTVDNLFTAALEMMFTEQQIDLINDRLYRGIDIEFEEIQTEHTMETNLDWFRSHIRKRIYKVEGTRTDPESRDGIFVQDQEHAKRLYESGHKYSRTKIWN